MEEFFNSKTFVGRYKEFVELDTVLKKEKTCVIWGSAGIGKTTFVNAFLFGYKKVNIDKVFIFKHHRSQFQIDDWENVCTKEIIVVDDIEDIRSFLYGPFYYSLLSTSAKSLILITRDDSSAAPVSSVEIGPLSQDESFLLINRLLEFEIKPYDKAELVDLAKGNPVLLEILAHLYKDRELSVDEIRYIWTLPENTNLISAFIQKNELPIPLLEEDEILIFKKLIVLGDIDTELFLRWTKVHQSEKPLRCLIAKGLVTISDNRMLRVVSGYNDYSNIELESVIDIEDSILSDMRNGMTVEEKYPERIIAFIEEKNHAVSFAVKYLRLKNKIKPKYHELHDMLQEVLENTKAIKSVSKETNENTKDIKRTSKETNENTKDIKRTSEETSETVKIIEERTADFYGFLCAILDQIRAISPDDKAVLEKLEELKEYALHPKKGMGERTVEAIGFLGSVASIASSPQGAQLITLLRDCFEYLKLP